MEQRPGWKQILWVPLYDAVEKRFGQKGVQFLALVIFLVVGGVAFYKLWPSNPPSVGEVSSYSHLYNHLDPKEHYLLASLAKFQKENGLKTIALTQSGYAMRELPRAEPNQPIFDFRTDLFGPPEPVSDDRPEFQIVLQNIPERYLKHYKTRGSSFWISVTDEGYRYLAKNQK